MESDPFSLPFVHRKMLDFEFATTLGLRLVVQAASTYTVLVRGATKSGPFTFSHVCTGNASFETDNFPLADAPIWVTVSIDTLQVKPGNIFASVSLTVNGDILQNLTAGYLHTQQSISWPNTTIKESGPFNGNVTAASIADPGAGAELSWTAPDYYIIKILAVTFNLVNAASAGNRFPHLVFTRGGNVLFESIPATASIISANKDYHCQQMFGTGSVADDDDIIMPLPPNLWLTPADTIYSETTALAGGDVLSAGRVMYERYFFPYHD